MIRSRRIAAAGMLLSIACVLAQRSQTPAPANPPSFEVVDLKPSDPNNPLPRGKGRVLPGGRLEVAGITLTSMIMMGWGVQEDMITGLPKWAATASYDLVAKAPPDSSQPAIRPMVQTMLADHFKLAIHREDRIRPAFVLTVGNHGPKLQQAAGGPQTCTWLMPDSGLRRRECHNLTMAEFAKELPGWGGLGIDLPVLDETGLKGAYDLNLDVGFEKREPNAPGADAADPGPTVFNAIEKLGLKLESRKVPVSLIVVDHVEQP